MFRFCYQEYVVSESKKGLDYFTVNKVLKDSIEITLYQVDGSNRVNYQDLKLPIHETDQEQFVEILGTKVFASKYYYPETKIAVCF